MAKPLVILNFHGVGLTKRPLGPGEADVWLGAKEFRSILNVIAEAKEGNGIDLEITFDDGNKSDVDIVLPLLLEHGLAARFFVLAGRLSDSHALSAQDLCQLAQQGMTIGSHGMDHVDWRTLTPDAMRRELHDARKAIEDAVGCPVHEAGIPFGSYDRRVLASLKQENYRVAYSSDGGIADRGSWLQARNTIRRGTSREALAMLLRGEAPKALRLRRRVARLWKSLR